MPSYQYRKSHGGDKTILRPSYLHNGISYTGKTSLYWIGAQVKSSSPYFKRPTLVLIYGPSNSVFPQPPPCVEHNSHAVHHHHTTFCLDVKSKIRDILAECCITVVSEHCPLSFPHLLNVSLVADCGIHKLPWPTSMPSLVKCDNIDLCHMWHILLVTPLH